MLKQILAVFLFLAITASPLRAQTNSTEPAMLSAKDTVEIEKQKLEMEQAVAINKRECDKTEALNKQDAEKSEVLNGQDARKMMVHDLAWNSWVIAVLGILLICNIAGHKRNKLMQETVRLMVEKGAPVTPEVITALKSKNQSRSGIDPYGHLAWGLILVAVGAGLLMLYMKAGWIVLLVGAAFFILWVVDRLTSKVGQSK